MHIPSYYNRTQTALQWFTQDPKRECKWKQRLQNRVKKTGKLEHKKRYKESQKKVQRSLRQARWRYINGILQAGLDDGSSKPFWNYIRRQKQDHMGVSPLKKNGQLHPYSTTKCDILADQFKSVTPTTRMTPMAPPNCMDHHTPKFKNLSSKKAYRNS